MNEKIKVGSLFSGIGGIELGLERAGGFETAWFCDCEPYAVAILNERWPGTPVFPDVTTLNFENVPEIDVLTGGFPCQDISNAGKRAGIEGRRSGLWVYCAEAIRVLRPKIAFFENVSALTRRGLDAVLCDLAALGYDAEWNCIPASAIGAPHQRDRIAILAYPNKAGLQAAGSEQSATKTTRENSQDANVADSDDAGQSDRAEQHRGEQAPKREGECGISGCSSRVDDVADAEREQNNTKRRISEFRRDAVGWGIKAPQQEIRPSGDHRPDRCGEDVADAISDTKRSSHGCKVGNGECGREESNLSGGDEVGCDVRDGGWWAVEPRVGRVAHGVPQRVDRIKCLGNAVVPAWAEAVAEAIKEKINLF